MHDLHQAQKIAQIIISEARKCQLKKISQVLIELGDIEEYGESLNIGNLAYQLKIFLEQEFTVAPRAIKIKKMAIAGWRIKTVVGEKFH